MGGKHAARGGEPTAHGGALEPSEANATVTINGYPAAVVPASHACQLHGPESCPTGSETVKIGGRRALRKGDYLLGSAAPNRIADGSRNVVIGTPGHGVGSAQNLSRYCASYCALKKDWPKLSPAEREERYKALVAEMFATFGAPAPRVTLNAPPGSGASWDEKNWALMLPPGAFDGPKPPGGAATLHEIRHAEQSFGAIREVLTPRPDGAPVAPSDLSEDFYVPPEVLWAAAQRPVDRNSPEGRWARVMAAEIASAPGRKAMNKVIRNYYKTASTGNALATRNAYQAYKERPVGEDADDVGQAGACGGC